MKKIVAIVFLLAATMVYNYAISQNVLQVTELPNRTQHVLLDSDNDVAEVVFVSKNKHLFIESSRQSLDTRLDPQKNRNGEWEYVIRLKLKTKEYGTTNERTFVIKQSGTTNMVTVDKHVFYANTRTYFEVQTLKNVIFLVDNTQPNDVYFSSGEAAVEIYAIAPLEIKVHDKLPCRIEKGRNEAGAYKYTVVVNTNALSEIKKEIDDLQSAYNTSYGDLASRAENNEYVRDWEWDSLTRVQELLETKDAELGDMTKIYLVQKESNTLMIDVLNITNKRKWVYAVKSEGKTGDAKTYVRRRWLVLGNYAFSPRPQHSFGLTVGNVGKIGWYANIMTNAKFSFGEGVGEDQNYLWSGEASTSRLSFAVGGLVALGEFGYVNIGAGYGIRTLSWNTLNGDVISIASGRYEGFMLDAGLVVNAAEHFVLFAGFDIQVPQVYYEFKFGVGLKF